MLTVHAGTERGKKKEWRLVQIQNIYYKSTHAYTYVHTH